MALSDSARLRKNIYNSGYRAENRSRIKEYKREYSLMNKDRAEEKRVEKKYGLTVWQYRALLEKQNGKCGICGCLPEGTKLAVDHNHKSGRVRGLLCIPCNLCLGAIEKDISWGTKAVKYLLDTTNA